MCYITKVKGCILCDVNNIVVFRTCDNDDGYINLCEDLYNYEPDENESMMYVRHDIPDKFIAVCSSCTNLIMYGSIHNIDTANLEELLSVELSLIQYISSQLTLPSMISEDILTVGSYIHKDGYPVALICGKYDFSAYIH